MAEINIQKKKRPVLPWILLVILIVVIIWVGIDYFNSPKNETGNYLIDSTAQNYGTMNDTTSNEKINQYVNFINDTSSIKAGNESQYILGGINLLTSALNSLSYLKTKTNFSMMQDSLNQLNEKIQLDSTSNGKSRIIKKYFVSAAALIDSFAVNRNGNYQNNIKSLEKYADNINPQKSIANQIETVKHFFKSSGEVLISFTNNKNEDRF